MGMRTIAVYTALSALLVGVAPGQDTAHAFVSTCSATVAGKVTGTSGCELGSVNNDFLNPPQINEDSLFGFTDWAFLSKDNDVNGVDEGSESGNINPLNLSLTGGVNPDPPGT